MKKKILLLNTGGTISCIKTANGYEPAAGYVEQKLAETSVLLHAEMPDYFIKEYSPLLDSSNMGLNDWNQIGSDINNNYHQYDGFIVLHGTDTMAYTASALSFMLENLDKPVIITGSQIPLSEIRNDALDNLVTSLWLCAHEPINEVCIYFNEFLLRGNRAQKVSAQRFTAFDSPNYPHLATIGINIELKHNLLLPKPQEKFTFQAIEANIIANFRIFPGFALDVLDYLLEQPIKGLVLETYGAGNAPNNNQQLLELLHKATKKGVIIVNCTQCQHGGVKMSQYATGYTLKQAGLISGHDMTPEAAHCKLLYLFSKSLSSQTIHKMMEDSLVGELTQEK